MTVAVGRQGLEFLWAAALGLGLAILYDVGRALRRQRQRLTLPVDLLFAALFFLGLWLTSIYTRGLRLYQCLGVALGAAVWFLTLSPRWVRLIRRMLRALRRLGGRLLLPGKKTVNFLRKTTKKLFPTLKKWSRIGDVSRMPRRRREARP